MIRGGIVTLTVKDVGSAVRFYVETLGMKLVEEAPPHWAVIDAGEGLQIGLHGGRSASAAPPGPDAPSIGFHAKLPLAETIAILENRGVVVTRRDQGPRSFAHFADLDGNALYVFEQR